MVGTVASAYVHGHRHYSAPFDSGQAEIGTQTASFLFFQEKLDIWIFR